MGPLKLRVESRCVVACARRSPHVARIRVRAQVAACTRECGDRPARLLGVPGPTRCLGPRLSEEVPGSGGWVSELAGAGKQHAIVCVQGTASCCAVTSHKIKHVNVEGLQVLASCHLQSLCVAYPAWRLWKDGTVKNFDLANYGHLRKSR